MFFVDKFFGMPFTIHGSYADINNAHLLSKFTLKFRYKIYVSVV